MKDFKLDEGMLEGLNAVNQSDTTDVAEPEAPMLDLNDWFLPTEPSASKAIASGSMDEIHTGSNYPKNPQTWLLLVLNALQSHFSSIKLSTLDMTCAFSVSDLRKPDMPLIYCSPTFEQLTKYTLQEVEGRNHRFMQSPNGEQRAGEFRKHTDHASVIRMMQDLSIGNETQVTLSNYVKSSERWTNLLTMIPIVLNPHGVVDFYVGLQLNIDLFPENILKLPDGSFEIDYKVKPSIERPLSVSFEDGKAITSDSYLQGTSPDTSHWALTLSNEIVDTMMIVSTLGKVLQVSPSITRLLGYEPEFLVGSYLSSILHPADLAQVLHEFSVATENAALDFTARLRQYSGPFLWVGFVGQVLTSTHEGKLIVLSGRRLLLLSGDNLGGIVREREFWCRLSLDGMVLFASAPATALLGLPQAQLLGMHFKDFIVEHDRDAFAQACSAAAVGIAGKVQFGVTQGNPVYGNTATFVSEVYPGRQQTEAGQTFLLVRTFAATDSADNRGEEWYSRSVSTTMAQSAFQQSYTISLQPLGSTQMLAALSPDRNTAWQMELQQTRMINQKLRTAVQVARNHASQVRNASVSSTGSQSSATRILQCSVCHTKETTQWRTGPQGARLCNSCGLSWRKRTR